MSFALPGGLHRNGCQVVHVTGEGLGVVGIVGADVTAAFAATQ
jgi:hypothetical protein